MKNALVVGGSSGIGKGLASELKSRGIQVFVADIHADPSKGELYIDATQEASVALCHEQVCTHTDRLELLLITIGAIDEGALAGASPNRLQWLLDVNVFGVMNVINTFLPLLRKSPSARILLTGSGAAFGPADIGSKLGLYTIAKHTLYAYFKVLRAELAIEKIQVSLLVPTGIVGLLADNSAKMRTNKWNETYDPRIGQQPLNRVLTEAREVSSGFINAFLAGAPIITNEPDWLAEKLKLE